MEVRYQMLRPEQIVTRREACPVVYIPIGTLEWHGMQNAVGADTLQAEGIALRCAEAGGGLVFPPLYYGENRLEALMEANAGDREAIAREMHLPPENFNPDRFPYSAVEQTHYYQHLLQHILAEAETLGFKVAVLVAGHYPLIDHARAAVLQYMQRSVSRNRDMVAWAVVDYLLLKPNYEHAGDHAGIWETSHMMALHPDTVRLDLLPEKGEQLIGTTGFPYPQDASAAFGREIIDRAVDIIINETRHRLEQPRFYLAHGMALAEGLWR